MKELITLEHIRKKYPVMGFTFIHLLEEFGGDHAAMWEAYFTGGFDEALKIQFEAVIHPQTRAAAMVCFGFIQELRKLVGELREANSAARSTGT